MKNLVEYMCAAELMRKPASRQRVSGALAPIKATGIPAPSAAPWPVGGRLDYSVFVSALSIGENDLVVRVTRERRIAEAIEAELREVPGVGRVFVTSERDSVFHAYVVVEGGDIDRDYAIVERVVDLRKALGTEMDFSIVPSDSEKLRGDAGTL